MPEAMSQATTGASQRVDRVDRGPRGATGRAVEAGPEDRVDDRPRAGERARPILGPDLDRRPAEPLEVRGRVGAELAGGPDQQDVDLVARRRAGAGRRPGRRRRCCPCRRRSGSARARRRSRRLAWPAQHRPSPSARATGRPAPRSPSDRPPASRRRRRSGSSQSGVSTSRQPTPAGGSQGWRARRPPRLSREWVSETTKLTPRSAARSAARPCRRSAGAGPPTTSMSRGPQPPPERLDRGLLGGEAGREVATGTGAARAVRRARRAGTGARRGGAGASRARSTRSISIRSIPSAATPGAAVKA